MEWRKEVTVLVWIAVLFGAAYFLPVDDDRFREAVFAMLDLTRWYAREHVVLCLLPAFFIAGVIAIFVSQGSVIRYFGANAKKWLAYSVAAVSGTILAVCSCTILPLFSSIRQRGAGLGPAVAFLYSGPAVNILAIILTARILGFELGLARTIGAIGFAVVIGLLMAFIYRKEEREKAKEQVNFPSIPEKRPLGQTMVHFFSLVFILIFANWGKPGAEVSSGPWFWIWENKWWVTAGFAMVLAGSLAFILKIRALWVAGVAAVTALSGWLIPSPLVPMLVGVAGVSIITLLDKKDPDNREWTLSAWGFARQILPLLAIGVMVSGFLLGSTHEGTQLAGVIPGSWIAWLVGGNSVFSNFFASLAGALMYFATLTEVPIVQGLLSAGMGKGPALALLLAGPSLSLPNMLVIARIMGWEKTLVYAGLVVIMATFSGWVFGVVAG
ncbi:MAG: permease [Haliscomenobacter sp.]|nr:permease [Haliscomenobacter sp.]MBP9075302.1 permease [Haliscomenobacter sp.]